ncbi:MAG: winged helix-turn-helix domain-containing protein [Pseudomonadota bacterium]|nr:winged helix-turn-helix domain-containing protein [Pseudomonadota bacterium]
MTDAWETIRFGPFRLSPAERLLTREGAPVELGGRTLDLLIALVARANDVVGKRELMAAVWPDVIVEETSLRFHVTTLRRALGDGRDGARYIATVAGRGYSFVARVGREAGPAAPRRPRPVETNLPARLTRVIGRGGVVADLAADFDAFRLVTIAGAGGVGKTTVAVATGRALEDRFEGRVVYVDLGVVAENDHVAATIASVLGLPAQDEDADIRLIAHLRGERLLLILDTCEHVVAGVARLLPRILVNAPQLRILATSREPLRIEGEHVHRLAPLAVPPEEATSPQADLAAFPAIELFLERAAEGGMTGALDAEGARLVSRICRKLDGVPLAIEIAAGRVGAYGLAETATLLDRHFALTLPGHRTAPPRQQTLAATLDWSYALLTETERITLRRLAVFVGDFTLEAGLAVAAPTPAEQASLFGDIDSLIAKSLLATRPGGAVMRYRLLDTTRAYALRRTVDADEATALARRHAAYYRASLEAAATVWGHLSSPAERACHIAALGNVRAALLWCFGGAGDRRLGVALAAAAAPALLAMSWLTECQRWAAAALAELPAPERGGRMEMMLQGALGVSLTFNRGDTDLAQAAVERSYAIATARGAPLDRLRLLGPMQMLYFRTGRFGAALRHARELADVAEALGDGKAATLARTFKGVSFHLKGELRDAREELEVALAGPPPKDVASFLGFERFLAAIFLARTVWLMGDARLALERTAEAVASSEESGHPLSHFITLMWAVTVFLWEGDIGAAEDHIDRLETCAAAHGLHAYVAVADGFRGEVAVRKGDAAGGVARIRAALDELRAARYALLTTPLNLALAEGLIATGRMDDARETVREAIEAVTGNGDFVYMPELLRIRARIEAAMSAPGAAEGSAAGRTLRQAVALSRRQQARRLEARASEDLARLNRAPGPRAAGEDARTEV